jgi:hypothetical protein
MIRTLAFLILTLTGLSAVADTALDGSVMNTRIERIPVGALIRVTEPDGTVRYLSEDRRFVFVGKMYDLWKGDVMTAGEEYNQQINWNRNGVSLEKIAVATGEVIGSKTLVVAPECEDCRGLLKLAMARHEGDLNVVMIASTPEGERANSLVWCSKDRVKGLKTVYFDRSEPRVGDMHQECDRFGLMMAQQAAVVFGIAQLPLYVDEQGNGHVGESAIYAVSNKE